MTLNTIALELVPSNTDSGPAKAYDEARRVKTLSAATGLDTRIRHLMIPGMIDEDSDRPIEMKPKFDVLDYWEMVHRELPDMRGLCTQVTSFHDEPALRARLTALTRSGFEGIAFVGVPRTMSDGDGAGVAPTDALSTFANLVPHRGVILIPTRSDELGRFEFKCASGATYGMTQLLYSDAIVGFLSDFARRCERRPEILLSFGFVPKMEANVGLIDWLIKDPGNETVAMEQDFVRQLAAADQEKKRALLLDLYKRVIDGVVDLGFPLSLHLEATYGVSKPAFDTFAEMVEYWAPDR